MSASKPAKDVPNLDLMAKIAGSWETTMKKVMAKNKDLRRYMGKGGARIPAVLTRIFPLSDGPNVFSRGFECYLLNVHGAEPEDSEALIQGGAPGAENIKITVRFNPKADAPPPPVEMGPPPTELVLQSRSTRHFQTGEMDALSKLKPGQIVVLNGVSARAYIPREGGRWGLAFDVQFVESAQGLTITSLYPAARGAGTGYMFPNDFHFDESNPSSRYNRDETHFLSVFAAARSEDERRERLVRMARDSGETRLINRDWSEKTWAYKADGQAAKMKASLELVHTQWLPGVDIEKWSDTVLLGASLWPEQLADFGITDVDAWGNLAPMIFDKLDFKIFGCVDTKGTEVNFGGVESDKDVSFALQISGMGIIADIEGCYRRIGIPITADCVVDLQQLPGGAPGGGVAVNDADFADTLPAVVPVTGPGASSAIARKLTDMARSGRGDADKLEFVALMPYSASPAVLKGLPTLNAEEGSALVNALASCSDAEIVSTPKVFALYEMMATGKGGCVVAFAFCDGIIPADVKSARNKALITYMTGKAPSGVAAIEDGSAVGDASTSASASAAGDAPAVEELADDDAGKATDADADAEAGDVVVDDSESESRKRSAKKMTAKDKAAKGKRKNKRARHELPGADE